MYALCPIIFNQAAVPSSQGLKIVLPEGRRLMAASGILSHSPRSSLLFSHFRQICGDLPFSATSASPLLPKGALFIAGVNKITAHWIHSSVSAGFRCNPLGLGFGQHVRCLGSRADVLMKVNASGGEMNKGSWTCPKCQFINSAQHQRCMGCQEPDSMSISRSPTFGFSLGADSHNTRRIGLPQSIVKYCVLRSPHIDKKSREQFEMRINKLYMVVKTQSDDLQRKFFWLKRQRILGAQYEIIFSYKTRLPLKPAEQESP